MWVCLVALLLHGKVAESVILLHVRTNFRAGSRRYPETPAPIGSLTSRSNPHTTRTYAIGLAVSRMNDILDSQGYTQAAWWYRLPTAAWGFMAAIAIFSNALIGYSSHRRGITVFLVLPLAVSLAFFLIADIDSPRHGL